MKKNTRFGIAWGAECGAKDDEGNFVIDHQALLSYEQSF